MKIICLTEKKSTPCHETRKFSSQHNNGVKSHITLVYPLSRNKFNNNIRRINVSILATNLLCYVYLFFRVWENIVGKFTFASDECQLICHFQYLVLPG